MKRLDENTALAIVFGNTKRKKRTADLVTIAQAFEYLMNLYGSQKVLSQKVGLSAEMIRQFRKVLTLAPEVQEMLKLRRIDSLDVAYRISKISDSQIQIKAAQQVADLQSKDVRDIERLVSTTGMSVRDSKQAVLESKIRDLHIFVVDFTDEEHRAILERARKYKITPAEFIKQVVLDWLRSPEKPKSTRK